MNCFEETVITTTPTTTTSTLAPTTTSGPWGNLNITTYILCLYNILYDKRSKYLFLTMHSFLEALAISVNLTMYNVNETTFPVVKPVLEEIISASTNTPYNLVDATFVEIISTVLRDTVDVAVVNVTVLPLDGIHEIEVLELLENTTLFLSEINTGLDTRPDWDTVLHNAEVEYVSDVERAPGNDFLSILHAIILRDNFSF